MNKIALFFIIFIIAFNSRAQPLNIVTEEYAPFQYTEDNKIKGFSAEIVQEMLKMINMQTRIRFLPWARAYNIVQKEKNTLIFTMNRSKAREDKFKWIGPIAPREIWLYSLVDRNDIKVTSFEDVKKYKLGLVRDHSTTKLFKNKGFVKGRDFKIVANPDQNIKMLFKKRIELVTASPYYLSVKLKELKLKPSQLRKIFMISGGTDYHFAMHQDSSPELYQKLKQAFDKLKKNGYVDNKVMEYLSGTHK